MLVCPRNPTAQLQHLSRARGILLRTDQGWRLAAPSPEACTGSGAGGGTRVLREELNTNLGEERGCPSLCHSMAGGGKPSARQVNWIRWPGRASTTPGWFLSRSSLQNEHPHSHEGGPLHKPTAPFAPARFSFLTELLCPGQDTTTNHLGLSHLPHRPPPLPQNLDCHRPCPAPLLLAP